MVAAPVFVCLSASGLAMARRLSGEFGNAEIHGLAGRAPGADAAFADTMGHLRELFAGGRPVIGICAAGILMRAIAPLLSDKAAEPPVLAVAEDGSAVVPLIGGHRGANEMARRLGAVLGIAPAITTAGDARFSVALDAPPPGWRLANPQHAKPVMAALLSGASARLDGEAGWLAAASLNLAEDSEVALIASERQVEGSETKLVYHPPLLALGVGCERGCPAEELIALVEETLAAHGLAAGAVACVCSIDLKADEAAIHALAAHLDVPARFFSRDQLAAQEPRLANPSEKVRAEVGVAGVAEGAALAAIGEKGSLIVEKTKSRRATCAIARAAAPLSAERIGRPRGKLSIIGTGPGSAEWLSPQAVALLRSASDWVGYGLYLDLVAKYAAGKEQHRFPLGEEEARVRHALELAGQGREVALISSGDPGIYAIAALAFELLDPETSPPLSEGARRVEIEVAPGISAFQAAAARAGAPFGHDFCLISLSDLLTPWAAIEKRLHAAAEGDFAVAFYNPRSMRRTEHLSKALEILKNHRPGDTPVIMASNLGRPKETLAICPLRDFDPEVVDMLTIVIVGSSATRTFTRGDGRAHAYTPRGYAAKREN